jgi:hypothetical protein
MKFVFKGGNGWTITNGGREIIPEKDNSVEKRVPKERSPAMITVVPIEAFRKMLTSSFPNLKEHLWTIPQQSDKFLKKFLTSCFIDQSNFIFYFWAIWLVNETGS